jgi:hypothetical protein
MTNSMQRGRFDWKLPMSHLFLSGQLRERPEPADTLGDRRAALVSCFADAVAVDTFWGAGGSRQGPSAWAWHEC